MDFSWFRGRFLATFVSYLTLSTSCYGEPRAIIVEPRARLTSWRDESACRLIGNRAIANGKLRTNWPATRSGVKCGCSSHVSARALVLHPRNSCASPVPVLAFSPSLPQVEATMKNPEFMKQMKDVMDSPAMRAQLAQVNACSV